MINEISQREGRSFVNALGGHHGDFVLVFVKCATTGELAAIACYIQPGIADHERAIGL